LNFSEIEGMKKQLLGLIVLVAAATAQAGVAIQHWRAPSGARVYFVESRALPIVDVNVDLAAGAAYDPAGKSGVASLTRSLMQAGAGDLDEEKIAGRLVDIGARLGGATDLDRAGFTLRTLSSPKERAAALELMRTVLQAPTFPEAVLEREKARTVAAIREADTRPDSILSKRFWAALYGGHPYGRNATVDSVQSINRDDLLQFYRSHYGAGSAVVSIIGDLSRAEAEELAQRLTEALPPGVADARLPTVTLPQQETVRIPHPAAQAHVALGLPALRRGDRDYFPLLVGNHVLGGGGLVSRLTKEVREKRGYAYSVYSYFHPFKLEGPFQVALQTKREQAAEAVQVVQATLQDFLEQGPTAAELATAKRNLIDGFGLRIDSNRKILEYLAVIGFYQLPLTYLDDFPKLVAKVSAEDVRAAFRRHVRPEHMVTVTVAADY
jgi:zinc protease